MLGKSRNFVHDVPALRFGEFDLGGVLYHSNYFHVYEMAREAFLASHGTSYADLVALHCHLAVVESSQQFHRPVFYGDPFSVKLSATERKRVSVQLHYDFISPTSSSPLHTATTKLVFVSKEGNSFKVSPLPEKLKAALQEISR